MKSTEVRTKIECGDTSTLKARIDQLNKAPAVTLVDSPSLSDASVKLDPLIQALVDKLPSSNTIWSINDRAKWLKAAAMAFNLVYRTDEANESDLKIENPSSLKRVDAGNE